MRRPQFDSHNPPDLARVCDMSSSTFGPLPSRCLDWSADGDIVLLFSSAKVSQISATNAEILGSTKHGHDRNAATLWQLFLQVVAQTFLAAPEDGGAFFFTRVDPSTRELRQSNPYSPLTGPHEIDLFVCLTQEQAAEFMRIFALTMNPDPKEQTRKRRKVEIHDLSWKNVALFSEYGRRCEAKVRWRYDGAGGTVLASECTRVPDEGEYGLREFHHKKPMRESQLAHPFYLYNAEHVVGCFRDKLGLAVYDYCTDDFFKRTVRQALAGDGLLDAEDGGGAPAAVGGDHAEPGRPEYPMKLCPSKKIAEAGLIRPFTAGQFATYFSDTYGPNADAIWLWQAPWFMEPDAQQIKEEVERSCAAVNNNLLKPEDIGLTEGDEFYPDFYRLLLNGQAFTDAQVQFYNERIKGKFTLTDPSRTVPIEVPPPHAGGEIGDSQLRKVYPVLSRLREKNTQGMRDAKECDEMKVYDKLHWLAEQAFDIARHGQENAITPTFRRLLTAFRTLGREIATSERPGDIKRYREGLFPHNSNDMLFSLTVDGVAHRFSPAAWGQLYFVSNCLAHIGATPTQMSMAILYYLAFYRICCHKMDKIVIAFFGDSGTGKSWITKLAGKIIIRALIVQGGCQSEKAKFYLQKNNDCMAEFFDEHKCFPTGEKTYASTSDQGIANMKMEWEAACGEATTVVEEMGPDGVTRRVAREQVYLCRGVTSVGANGPCMNKNLDDRLLRHTVENGKKSQVYSGRLTGEEASQFFRILQYNHCISQLTCCLIAHFVGGPIEPDTTAVDIFGGILEALKCETFGIARPQARRLMDLRKLAEAAMYEEVAKEVAGVYTGAGDREGTIIELSESDLAKLAVKCNCNLVVSAQNVVSSYFATNPLYVTQTRIMIEEELFSGHNLLWIDDSEVYHSAKGKTKKYAWDFGKPRRELENAVIVTSFESLEKIVSHCCAVLKKAESAKVASEPAIQQVIAALANPADGGRTTAVLEKVTVDLGNKRVVDKIAINLEAFSECTTKVEAVVVSGLLRVIGSCDLKDMLFLFPVNADGVPQDGGEKTILLPVSDKDRGNYYNAAHAILPHGSMAFAVDPLRIPEEWTEDQKGRLKEENRRTQKKAEDIRQLSLAVLNSMVYPPIARIAELATLFGESPPAGTKVADTKAFDLSDKSRVENNPERVTKAIKLSAQTIHTVVNAASLRSPEFLEEFGNGYMAPLGMLGPCTANNGKLAEPGVMKIWTPSDGAPNPPPNSVQLGATIFCPATEVKMPDTQYFIKVNPGRCKKIVADGLRKEEVGDMMSEVIQKFDNIMTGTADWRDENQPSMFAGNRAVVNGGHTELTSSVVKYKKYAEPVTIRNHYYTGQVDQLSLRFDMEEMRDMAPVHHDLFPPNKKKVSFPYGYNIHGRQVEKRLDNIFGQNWRDHPKIADLRSDWVKEFCCVGSTPSPASAPASAPGFVAGGAVGGEVEYGDLTEYAPSHDGAYEDPSAGYGRPR